MHKITVSIAQVDFLKKKVNRALVEFEEPKKTATLQPVWFTLLDSNDKPLSQREITVRNAAEVTALITPDGIDDAAVTAMMDSILMPAPGVPAALVAKDDAPDIVIIPTPKRPAAKKTAPAPHPVIKDLPTKKTKK